MKPLLTGVVLAIVFLAAMFVVPAFLPRSDKSETVQAAKEAELARRQLHSYDATMPLTAERTDLEQLKAADMGQLVERSSEDFAARQREFNRGIQAAKSLDRRSGLDDSKLQSISPGAGAVNGFEKAVRDNEKLLAEAVKNARTATQTDRNALGVGQIAGTTKLVEADKLLDDARLPRAELARELDRWLSLAVRGAEIQSLSEHYAGLDLTDVGTTLTADLAEVGARIDETGAELQSHDQALAAARQALATITSEMQAKHTRVLDLEKTGFELGNTEAFRAYRAEYERLSNELGVLQLREQTLTHGGIEGGAVANDDLATGEIQGGELVVGIDELEQKTATLRTKLERLEKAKQTLESQRTLVTGLTSESQSQRTSCGAKLQAVKAEMEQVRTRVAELAQQSLEKEEAAMQATQAAVSGFQAAKSAAEQWKRDAGAQQSKYDAPRLNERLKLIMGDETTVGAASSGEAQATTLLGRIKTERALSLKSYLSVAARVAELLPDAGIDTAALSESFTQAHDQAIETLNAAREMYERLAQKQSATQWVHQSSLATIYHLLASIDETNAAQHRSNLLDLLTRVVQGRQQFPYLKEQAMLLSALGGSVTPTPQPSAPPAEAPAPAEAPTDEG